MIQLNKQLSFLIENTILKSGQLFSDDELSIKNIDGIFKIDFDTSKSAIDDCVLVLKNRNIDSEIIVYILNEVKAMISLNFLELAKLEMTYGDIGKDIINYDSNTKLIEDYIDSIILKYNTDKSIPKPFDEIFKEISHYNLFMDYINRFTINVNKKQLSYLRFSFIMRKMMDSHFTIQSTQQPLIKLLRETEIKEKVEFSGNEQFRNKTTDDLEFLWRELLKKYNLEVGKKKH